MSFSMIFSIILIIFFIAVAFMAIKYFLRMQNCAKIGSFVSDFQTKITEAWDSQKSSYELKTVLPTNIKYVCFADLSKNIGDVNQDVLDELEFYAGGTASNMFLYPKDKTCDMPVHNIKHLDIAKITNAQNPHCIEVKDGMVYIQIQKGYADRLVSVS